METLYYRFGAALFIGLLIGLQREYASDRLETADERRSLTAGVRTFALFGMGGCLAAFLADLLGLPALFLGLVWLFGALIIISYGITSRNGDPGMTSEAAAIITLLIGGLCYFEYLALAVGLGVTTTVLLSFKIELHRFAENLSREDIVATLKFAIITAIILPVLPNSAWEVPPFDVLNPYNIWLMVVLISGISFLGYVLIKIVGSRVGIGLTGLLGGLVSSTAVTLSFSQRSQRDTALARPFALAITVGWTVMFARVLVEVAAVNAPLLTNVWLPIVVAGGIGLVYCLVLLYTNRYEQEEGVELSNPFELGPAIKFGLLYGVILLLSRAAEYYFGQTGLFVSSIIAGLADVDAITLSMADLSRTGTLEAGVAGQAIILATMSNTILKGGIVLTSGSRALRRVIWPALLLMVATGLFLGFAL